MLITMVKMLLLINNKDDKHSKDVANDNKDADNDSKDNGNNKDADNDLGLKMIENDVLEYLQHDYDIS